MASPILAPTAQRRAQAEDESHPQLVLPPLRLAPGLSSPVPLRRQASNSHAATATATATPVNQDFPESRASPATLWETFDDDDFDDEASLSNILPPQTSQRGTANLIDDDAYLLALAEGDFSSPSTYPPITRRDLFFHHTVSALESALLDRQGLFNMPPLQLPLESTNTDSNPTAPPRDPSAAYISPHFLSNNIDGEQAGSSPINAVSQSTLNTLDSLDDAFITDTPATSFSSDNMPITRRSSRGAAADPNESAVHVNKRRRTLNNSPQGQPKRTPAKNGRRLASKEIDDLLFKSPPHQGTPLPDDCHTIDLTEANDVPDQLKPPAEDNRVKLSGFQCVICMDDATTLTVTHCGMFDFPGSAIATSVPQCSLMLTIPNRSFVLRRLLAPVSPR